MMIATAKSFSNRNDGSPQCSACIITNDSDLQALAAHHHINHLSDDNLLRIINASKDGAALNELVRKALGLTQ